MVPSSQPLMQSRVVEEAEKFCVSIHASPLSRHSTDAIVDVAVRRKTYSEEKIEKKLNKKNVVIDCGDKHRKLSIEDSDGDLCILLSSAGKAWSIDHKECQQKISLGDLTDKKYVVKTFCLRKDDPSSSWGNLSLTLLVGQEKWPRGSSRELQLHAKVPEQLQVTCPHCKNNLDDHPIYSSMSSVDSDTMDPVPESCDGAIGGDDVTHPVQADAGKNVPVDSGTYSDPGMDDRLEMVENHFDEP